MRRQPWGLSQALQFRPAADKRMELNIGWKDRISRFNYWINFNIADNTNKIIRYDGQNVVTEGLNGIIEGMPINSIYGIRQTAILKLPRK